MSLKLASTKNTLGVFLVGLTNLPVEDFQLMFFGTIAD